MTRLLKSRGVEGCIDYGVQWDGRFLVDDEGPSQGRPLYTEPTISQSLGVSRPSVKDSGRKGIRVGTDSSPRFLCVSVRVPAPPPRPQQVSTTQVQNRSNDRLYNEWTTKEQTFSVVGVFLPLQTFDECRHGFRTLGELFTVENDGGGVSV